LNTYQELSLENRVSYLHKTIGQK